MNSPSLLPSLCPFIYLMPPGSAKVVETSLGEAGIYYFFSLTIIREEREREGGSGKKRGGNERKGRFN